MAVIPDRVAAPSDHQSLQPHRSSNRERTSGGSTVDVTGCLIAAVASL